MRIELPKANRNKDHMLSLLTLPVMPETFWKNHKLNEPLSTPPLASGPYKIRNHRVQAHGASSSPISRVKDYWAANLPVNRGRWNFDTLRYDYYLDDNVAFEAFKAGAYDLRVESSAKNWATQYQGGNFASHAISSKTSTDRMTSATDTRWLAFNIQRPVFADRRVREAISLAFDFEWMNKALFYGAYKRADSYFQNTEYAARSYPDSRRAGPAGTAERPGAAGGVHQHLPAALLRRQRQRSAKSAESDPTAERSRLGGQKSKVSQRQNRPAVSV